MDHEGLARLSRRRQRRQTERERRYRAWSLVRIAVVGLVSVSLDSAVALVGTFAYTYAQVSQDLPELDNRPATALAQTSVVYDSIGNVVDGLHGVQNRLARRSCSSTPGTWPTCRSSRRAFGSATPRNAAP